MAPAKKSKNLPPFHLPLGKYCFPWKDFSLMNYCRSHDLFKSCVMAGKRPEICFPYFSGNISHITSVLKFSYIFSFIISQSFQILDLLTMKNESGIFRFYGNYFNCSTSTMIYRKSYIQLKEH